MTKRWKKADAEKMIAAASVVIADRFGIEAPDSGPATHRSGRDWQFRTEEVKVWTSAGRARIVVDCSATFAHLYLQFDEPKRAAGVLGRHDLQLNQHSGKWNDHETPLTDPDLSSFLKSIAARFDRVAVKEPSPEDVLAAEERERQQDLEWAAYANSLRQDEPDREDAPGL